MGGSARPDVQSLAILRPAAALYCGFGLWSLSRDHLRDYRALFAMLFAIVALLLLQLMPLPPSIWQNLPGREIVIEAEKAAGLTNVWRPISFVPSMTANALFALLIPAAVLLNFVQLDPDDKRRGVVLLLALGVFSGVLGMAQVAGSAGGPLYFYRITNEGSAVGLFANRNHHAVFLACLFPLLAVFASSVSTTVEAARIRLGAAMLIGIVLVPLLLVTGSRAGLALALPAIGAAFLIYRKPEISKPAKRGYDWNRVIYFGGAMAAVALGLLTILFARAEAFERLTSADQVEDLRWQMWGPIADLAWKVAPFGSGAGSFVETYQLIEPRALLLTRYVNQAHNDWLDVALTSGLPGLLLLFAAMALWVAATFRLWFRTPEFSRKRQLGRAGSVIVLIMGLASLGDYPLRVPSLSVFLVLAAIWMANALLQETKTRQMIAKMDGIPDGDGLAGIA